MKRYMVTKSEEGRFLLIECERTLMPSHLHGGSWDKGWSGVGGGGFIDTETGVVLECPSHLVKKLQENFTFYVSESELYEQI